MRIIGIDPGSSGAIAMLDTSESVQYWKMPDTEMDLWDCLVNQKPIAAAFIEKVHAMPRQGVSSTFKFGRNYGMLLMALTASGIPFTEVTPQTWQKSLNCMSKGDKNVTKRRAQQLFPQLKVTHAIADALLIAEYGRRVL